RTRTIQEVIHRFFPLLYQSTPRLSAPSLSERFFTNHICVRRSANPSRSAIALRTCFVVGLLAAPLLHFEFSRLLERLS
ncbi:hypothetical protein CONLIGDRAFT_666558, partial [Coniochaeta ligniaria NRRL 30616]